MINVCILRMRRGKKKKDYLFESIANAGIFEETFLSHPETKGKVSFEILAGEKEETIRLMQTLSRNPKKYAEKEFLNLFTKKKETQVNPEG